LAIDPGRNERVVTAERIRAPIEDVVPFPEGARVVHIGPPKTGTTSLQGAFDRARSAVLAQGVRYVGPRRHSRRAVLVATQAQTDRPLDVRAGQQEWDGIIAEARSASEPRVLFSSERLSHAEAASIPGIVEAFDAGRVHVIVTLRPLAKILPSQWQQCVQSGQPRSLDAWLERAFAASPDDSRSIWHWHRHDRLVARWAAVVGIDRTTVVVVDDRDRQGLLQAFEGLLGLHPGTLRLHDELSNRSLTLPEVEALRAFNRLSRERGVPSELRWRLLDPGTSRRLQRRVPAKDEAPVRLPAWAAPQVASVADEVVAGIRATGVRVIGDLDVLRRPADILSTDEDATFGGPDVAGSLAMALFAAGGALPWPPDSDGAPIERLQRVSSRRLAVTLANRLRSSATRVMRVARERLG
jgi:hypothetical protein